MTVRPIPVPGARCRLPAVPWGIALGNRVGVGSPIPRHLGCRQHQHLLTHYLSLSTRHYLYPSLNERALAVMGFVALPLGSSLNHSPGVGYPIPATEWSFT